MTRTPFSRTAIRLSAVLITFTAAVLIALRGADEARVKEELLWRHRNLGKAFYENQTTHAEAVEEFRKALELAPDSLRERVNYALALLRTHRVEEGVAELEKVQKQDPSIPHTWFNLGIAYKKNGQYQRAIEQLTRMAQLVPDEPVTRFNLGVLYRYLGKTKEALQEFKKASDLDPNFGAPLFQIFDTHREAERMDEAARALKRFQEVKQKKEGPDAEAEDTNWSYYSEIYEVIDPKTTARESQPPAEVKFDGRKLPGTVDPITAGMAALDFDVDGLSELLVWSSRGILLYRNGSLLTDSTLAGVKDVTHVAPGDYNNDGLADLCVLTESGPALYLNQNGRFQKQDAALPGGRFERAVWLDYDHDYDLDLFLLGKRSALFRNQGASGFEDRTADFPFVSGHATDAVAFRLITDTKSVDLLVSYKNRAGILYRDKLLGAFEATPVDALPSQSDSLAAHDIDNDGWIDIAFRTQSALHFLMNRSGALEHLATGVSLAGTFAFADLENRALLDIVAGDGVLRNQGLGRFTPLKTVASLVNGVVWIQADSDRDGRADLAAVSSDGSVHVFTNQTSGENNWLSVTLTGVKNLKLAAQTDVEVKAGSCYQKKVYKGWPLSFGVRNYKQIDTVRITWPNGMIQNETRQAVNLIAKYQEAPRLSGSCPMIFTWNGREFEFITDVLGVAPLGAASGDGEFFPVDHDEYVQISGRSLVPHNGKYEIRIAEELSEVSYLDQIRLIAVDHPQEAEIFSNDKWKGPPWPEFRLYGVKERVYPRAARDHRGRDVRSRVVRRDRIYADGFRRDYAGVAEQHAIELDFGEAARDNRAVLVLTGWVDWADGSTFLKASQESEGGLMPPYLQVKDASGRWRTVLEDMGMPSGKTKTIAVDLTGKFLSESREIRIVTNLCVYWDEIFLGEDSSSPPVKLTPLEASEARLGFRGFSRRRIHPERKQPEHFEYGEVQPVSNWNPTPGLYTRYGEVRELVLEADDRMVVMGSGDELKLSFEAASLPPLPAGWRRDFLLLVDGWAKDRDANTAYSQTVEPLPFHGMSRYPYPPEERFPDTPLYQSYRKNYLTRPALRLIRPMATARP